MGLGLGVEGQVVSFQSFEESEGIIEVVELQLLISLGRTGWKTSVIEFVINIGHVFAVGVPFMDPEEEFLGEAGP